jgi:hypothetical protein
VMELPDNSRSPQELSEMFELVWALRDGTLTPEQAARLDELVCEHPANRQAYFDLIGLLTSLRGDLPPSIEPDMFPRFLALDQETNELVVAPSTTPLIRSSSRRLRLTPHFIRLAASLLVVGYFVAVAGLLVWDRSQRGERHNRGMDVAAEPFATLTRADDYHWEETSPIEADNRRIGRRLQVHTGLAELRFADGAKVVIEGPAEFEVRSANGGFLRIGRLAAHVPPRAIGFEVETPTARVLRWRPTPRRPNLR